MPDSEPIPLARPELGAREEELVLEAIRSGRLSLGPMLDRFERAFADWLGVDDAVALSSGTAALHLGVRALGWGEGDEVVTSPFSFVASANCLLYERATPVFADVDPETLNLDPEAAAAAVGERTAGLLPVHIFGCPAETPAFESLARERGLGLLEDACQSLGAVGSDGTPVGAGGNLTTFAFYGNKQLVTGEGGMLVPDGPATAERARSERNQGRAPDMGSLAHDRLGFNYRLTDLAAALGIAQLERIEQTLTRRDAVAELYREALSGVERLRLLDPRPAGTTRSWFVYVIQLPPEADREAVIADLAQRGVASKAYLPCIHLLPFYRERFGFRGGEFPVAEEAAERSLALPFFAAMGSDEVDRVASTLAEALGQRAWA